MKIELLIGDRHGSVYDVSELITEVTWKTKRKGKPSSLDFEMLKDDKFTFENGSTVSLRVDGNNVFYGYVFEYSLDKGMSIKVTAYDQIRYLLYNDTYVFTNKKSSEIITEISNALQLKLGTIEDTGHVIPNLVEEDKKLLDIIYSSLEKTLLSTKQTFTFYDDFGDLCLRNINNMKQEVVISDDSNLGNYDWKTSIDGDTYNVIKLVKDNKEEKKRQVYIARDKKNIEKWGRLQYYKKIDEKMSDDQIKTLLDGTLKLKNREEKTLKLKDVIGTSIQGDVKLRAGSGVWVEIKEKNIKQFYLIEEATHKFSNNSLVMDFDLKVV